MEKRKLKRRQLIYYLKVLDRETENLVGRLADITTEGIMLLSNTPLETNKEFKLKLVLPSEISGDHYIELDAKSLWSKKDLNPDIYGTGFSFVEIASKDIDTIQALVADFELPS